MQIVDILELLVPNVWTAITQLCATAVLFFLMYKLAYKPVRNILDERSRYEQSKLTEVEALKEENEKLNLEAKETIAQANKSAEAIVRKAREEGNSVKNELIEQGRQQSAQMMENAQRDLELQRSKMLKEVHSEIVDAAITAAEKVLESKIDSQSEKQSIDSFVKEVINK
ncbi:MAG: F0F1 ATP synthase subunit B [Erysipelotrichaceae bacterium]|nr:F0F1 ATP synthase subunit B [Erysipelotrichaceae bacterium]